MIEFPYNTSLNHLHIHNIKAIFVNNDFPLELKLGEENIGLQRMHIEAHNSR